MSTLLYLPVKENLHHIDIGEYVSYGVKISRGDEELKFVSDVSVDENFVKELCKICNDFQLDPIHIYDLIEDLLP